MMQETEEDGLDQSLRDTFSDFNLPPAGHIWRGIEERMAGLPTAPRPVPLLVLLPLVGVVGVAVGWLLPRPAALNPASRPTIVVPAKVRTASRQSQLSRNGTVDYTIPRASTAALAFRAPAADSSPSEPIRLLAADQTRQKRFFGASRRHLRLAAPATVADAAARPAVGPGFPVEELVAVRPGYMVQQALPASLSTIVVGQQAYERVGAIQQPVPSHSVDLAVQPQKADAPRERRPEYRVPTHRLAERGRGMRRIRNTIIRHWQHVFGSRRARVAAQPDF